MTEPIQNISNREADRASRLREVRATGPGETGNSDKAKVKSKEFFAKRRGLKRLNNAKLNLNQKEPVINWVKDAPFVPAFMAALLKDIFDLVILALEAAAGASVVLSPLIAVGISMSSVVTWCISIFIGLMLILAGQGGKRKKAKRIVLNLIKRGIVWGGFTIVESIPGLGVFPLETLMVVVIFMMVIAERKKLVRMNIVKLPTKQKQDAGDYRKAA